MKKVLVILLVSVAAYAQAQGQGPTFRQFFFNPYPFNPGYAGMANQSSLDLVYRKQWVGFEGAPTTAGLSLQMPLNQRVVLGFNLISDQQVLITNTSFKGSFTYVIPFSPVESIRFGLSGGVGMNSLNLNEDELNTSDPALIQAVDNTLYANGNFGAVYNRGGLKLGFALTELIQSNPLNTEDFKKFSFENLKNRLYSASYRFNINQHSNVTIEPWFIYHENDDYLQNYWETAALVDFNDKLWTGLGYNQHKGMALFFGMGVTDALRFSYSYEFSPFNSGVAKMSSHELHLSLKFGKQYDHGSVVSTPWKKMKRNTDRMKR